MKFLFYGNTLDKYCNLVEKVYSTEVDDIYTERVMKSFEAFANAIVTYDYSKLPKPLLQDKRWDFVKNHSPNTVYITRIESEIIFDTWRFIVLNRAKDAVEFEWVNISNENEYLKPNHPLCIKEQDNAESVKR